MAGRERQRDGVMVRDVRLLGCPKSCLKEVERDDGPEDLIVPVVREGLLLKLGVHVVRRCFRLLLPVTGYLRTPDGK